MYKVKVIKKGKVLIGDLNLSLTGGETYDLDERFPRSQIDASYNLNCAINGKNPSLAVLHKDVYVDRGISQDVLLAMEERIRKSIASTSVQPQTPPTSDVDAKFGAILDALKNVSNVSKSDSTDSVIDDDKSVQIQQRAIERLTKDTSGHVGSDTQVKESDAAKRAKELDGFDF